MKAQSEADRKKQALRDNLKRRKVQLREFGKDRDGKLSPRKDALKSKLASSKDMDPD